MSSYLVGIGNYSMSDDSIGLRLVEYFVEHDLCRDYEPLILNQDSTQLLFHFSEDTRDILVVDCVRMGRTAGEWLVFTPDEVQSQKTLAGVSSHEGDVLKVISLGRELECHIPPIRIFGVEPASTELGFDLSDTLKLRFQDMVEALKKEIDRVP